MHVYLIKAIIYCTCNFRSIIFIGHQKLKLISRNYFPVNYMIFFIYSGNHEYLLSNTSQYHEYLLSNKSQSHMMLLILDKTGPYSWNDLEIIKNIPKFVRNFQFYPCFFFFCFFFFIWMRRWLKQSGRILTYLGKRKRLNNLLYTNSLNTMNDRFYTHSPYTNGNQNLSLYSVTKKNSNYWSLKGISLKHLKKCPNNLVSNFTPWPTLFMDTWTLLEYLWQTWSNICPNANIMRLQIFYKNVNWNYSQW